MQEWLEAAHARGLQLWYGSMAGVLHGFAVRVSTGVPNEYAAVDPGSVEVTASFDPPLDLGLKIVTDFNGQLKLYGDPGRVEWLFDGPAWQQLTTWLGRAPGISGIDDHHVRLRWTGSHASSAVIWALDTVVAAAAVVEARRGLPPPAKGLVDDLAVWRPWAAARELRLFTAPLMAFGYLDDVALRLWVQRESLRRYHVLHARLFIPNAPSSLSLVATPRGIRRSRLGMLGGLRSGEAIFDDAFEVNGFASVTQALTPAVQHALLAAKPACDTLRLEEQLLVAQLDLPADPQVALQVADHLIAAAEGLNGKRRAGYR